jgi:RNA polymerase sigma factor
MNMGAYIVDLDLKKRLTKIIEDDDREERSRLIADYKPFIIKTVVDFTGRYVRTEHSEELSIALEAFNEAIGRYVPERGNFIGFAKLVINSRLKDYYRSVKDSDTIGLTPESQVKSSQDLEHDYMIKSEIEQYRTLLTDFGIDFDSLAQTSPVQQQTKETALMIAHMISEENVLYERLLTTHQLPQKQIKERVLVTKKQLMRSRNYIISVVLLLRGDFEMMRNSIDISKGS